jgi:hypothetical protein
MILIDPAETVDYEKTVKGVHVMSFGSVFRLNAAATLNSVTWSPLKLFSCATFN